MEHGHAVEWQDLKPYFGIDFLTGSATFINIPSLPANLTDTYSSPPTKGITIKAGVDLTSQLGIEIRTFSGGTTQPFNVVDVQLDIRSLFLKGQYTLNYGFNLYALAGVSLLKSTIHLNIQPFTQNNPSALWKNSRYIQGSYGAGLSYRIPTFSLFSDRNDQLTFDLEWIKYTPKISTVSLFTTYHY